MNEHLTTLRTDKEPTQNLIEIDPVSPEETEQWRNQIDSERETSDTARTEAVGLALKQVHETQDAADLETVIGGIDFSDDKFKFAISNTYHGEVKTYEDNTVLKGTARFGEPKYTDPAVESVHADNLWGKPATEAHYSHHPVEQVGIRKSVRSTYEKQEKRIARAGWAGKLGLKQKVIQDVKVGEETTYAFDYAFAAPSHGEDAAKRVGNYTGQQIHLSVELTKEQAEQLSGIIASTPKAARQVIDGFMRAKGDYGKWNAELYDEDGTFHDPGERYGTELEARDVRPTYDAVPDLEPRIMGLIDADRTVAKPEMFLPGA